MHKRYRKHKALFQHISLQPQQADFSRSRMAGSIRPANGRPYDELLLLRVTIYPFSVLLDQMAQPAYTVAIISIQKGGDGLLSLSRVTVGLMLIFSIMSIIGQFFTEDPANFGAVIFAAALAFSSWFGWKALRPELLTLPKFALAHFMPVAVVMLGFIPLFAPNKIGGFIIGGLVCIGLFSLVARQMHVQRKGLILSLRAANETSTAANGEVHTSQILGNQASD